MSMTSTLHLGKLVQQVLNEMEATEENLAYSEMIAPLTERACRAIYSRRDFRINNLLATKGLDLGEFIELVEKATSPKWVYKAGLYHLLDE